MGTYAHLTGAFEGGTMQDELGRAVTISTLPIGDLTIVSGATIVCDPIASGGVAAPFNTAVPNGMYPVLLSVATHMSG